MRILLLEDHPIFRFGVRQLVQQHWPDAEIGEAGTLAEGIALTRGNPVDIALVDLNLPDSEGLEVVAQLRRVAPETRLLVLSLNAEAAYARRALQMGASGYLAKDRAASELFTALERVVAGKRYISTDLAEQLADQLAGEPAGATHEELSDQEYRVMIRLAQGQRVGDIAADMHLSPKTVSTYRSRILDKLGFASNAELVRYCLNHQLVDKSS